MGKNYTEVKGHKVKGEGHIELLFNVFFTDIFGYLDFPTTWIIADNSQHFSDRFSVTQ